MALSLTKKNLPQTTAYTNMHQKHELTIEMANREIEKHICNGASVEDIANAITGSFYCECIVNKYEARFNANTDIVIHRQVILKHIKRTFRKLIKKLNKPI